MLNKKNSHLQPILAWLDARSFWPNTKSCTLRVECNCMSKLHYFEMQQLTLFTWYPSSRTSSGRAVSSCALDIAIVDLWFEWKISSDVIKSAILESKLAINKSRWQKSNDPFLKLMRRVVTGVKGKAQPPNPLQTQGNGPKIKPYLEMNCMIGLNFVWFTWIIHLKS
jgi:hypothetical protein